MIYSTTGPATRDPLPTPELDGYNYKRSGDVWLWLNDHSFLSSLSDSSCPPRSQNLWSAFDSKKRRIQIHIQRDDTFQLETRSFFLYNLKLKLVWNVANSIMVLLCVRFFHLNILIFEFGRLLRNKVWCTDITCYNWTYLHNNHDVICLNLKLKLKESSGTPYYHHNLCMVVIERYLISQKIHVFYNSTHCFLLQLFPTSLPARSLGRLFIRGIPHSKSQILR